MISSGSLHREVAQYGTHVNHKSNGHSILIFQWCRSSSKTAHIHQWSRMLYILNKKCVRYDLSLTESCFSLSSVCLIKHEVLIRKKGRAKPLKDTGSTVSSWSNSFFRGKTPATVAFSLRSIIYMAGGWAFLRRNYWVEHSMWNGYNRNDVCKSYIYVVWGQNEVYNFHFNVSYL